MTNARAKHLGPGLAVGEVGPVCVVLWRDVVDAPRFALQAAGVEEVVSRHPGRAAFVCIVEPTCAPPDDVHRKRSVALIDEQGERLACIAAVIEGSGFKAAIARSILSSMAILRRSRVPHRVFADVATASTWVATKVEVAAGELDATVESWRSELPPPLDP